MIIKIDTRPYNRKRYGKPWIAQVDFTQGNEGFYHWGDWVGDAHNGSEGTLLIEAEEGDIIATGQKDFFKPRNSAPNWYQVQKDGTLVYVESKAKAYKLTIA